MLRVKNLFLSFSEGESIFEDISFDIKENTINLITGKSGCGKSSLLMCLARVIPEIIEGNMSGNIILNESHIETKNTKDISGQIAYMFQDPESQLCTFNVEDEIAFGLENINTNEDDMEYIIDKYLDLVGIKHLKKKELNKLSGGEKQKVALASILAINPQLILMDEPTANLDPISRMEIADLIKKLKVEMGKTIILIEHNIDEFKDIIDYVIEVKDKGSKTINKDEFFKKYISEKNIPKRHKKKSSSDEIVLDVKNINFSYDNKKNILDDINFSLYKGEIAAIVGHNGAGKSTLTKLLIGFFKDYEGEIFLKDSNISNLNPMQIGEQMGLVFQNPEHQFIKLTVEKELSLSLEIRFKDKILIKSKTNEYLDKFDLIQNRKSNPFELSQGQKRRLSTASMMINGQSLLILDEPTYGQDKENLKKLVELLYEINKQEVTILMITHDLNLVSSCCDKIIYIDSGKIKYNGNDIEIVKEFFLEKRSTTNE